MRRARGLLSILAVAVLAAAFASVAYGVPLVYEGRGIGTGSLGMYDRTACNSIGLTVPRSPVRDTNYASQVVYRWDLKDRYRVTRVQVYADRYHKVFIFKVIGTAYRTSKDIGVGSTRAAVRSAYGTRLRSLTTPTYYKYVLPVTGTTKGTDFWVSRSTGKVAYFLIRKY